MHLYLSDPTRDFRSAAVAGLKPLIRHATTKRRDLHKRRNAPWLQRAILREGLDPAEERLLKFLNGALIPSAVLLLRAIEVSQGKYVNHDDVLGRIPEVLLSPGSTYRALYSLACFELAFANTAAQEAEIEPYFERALEALREAFCGAQGGSRRELGRWARRDPALGMLRESSLISGDVTYATRLQTLLDLYAVEQPGGQPAPE
jgi:hypothetical protein